MSEENGCKWIEVLETSVMQFRKQKHSKISFGFHTTWNMILIKRNFNFLCQNSAVLKYDAILKNVSFQPQGFCSLVVDENTALKIT